MKSDNNNLADLRQATAKPSTNRNLLCLLAEIIDILFQDIIQPLVDTTNELFSDKQSTLHLVIPVKVKLLQKFSAMPDDSELVLQLKEHLISYLNKQYNTHQMHNIAALLDRRMLICYNCTKETCL